MAEEVLLTQRGYDKLVRKLDELVSVKRIKIAERLKAAIALGDLSENSEYTDAKNEQALLEGEIKEIEAKLHNSKIIEGREVRVRLPNGEERVFTIAGSTEADIDEGIISNESPVGAALVGQPAGAVVHVHVPAGVLEYKILEVIKE